MDLISGDTIQKKVTDPQGVLAKMLAADRPLDQIVEDLYLRTVSRYPDAQEKQWAAERRWPRTSAGERPAGRILGTAELQGVLIQSLGLSRPSCLSIEGLAMPVTNHTSLFGRRDFVRIGSLGALGLNLAGLSGRVGKRTFPAS